MAITKVSRGLLSTGISDNSDATAITISSDENVGIKTTSPIYDLQIGAYGTDADSSLAIATATDGSGNIRFGDGTSGVDANQGKIVYDHSTNAMQFWTSVTERMRIDSSGTLFVGGTAHYSGGSNADDATLAVNGAIIRKGVSITDFDEAYIGTARGILEGTSTYQASNSPLTDYGSAGNFFYVVARTVATSGSASNNYILQVAYGLTGLQYTRYSSNNGSSWSQWAQRTT